ncbi:fumarylacetoacetate hydrolase family protein [Agrilactobacillus fermenti]|uniref:fumarylacetoacetate hydrolase family protein n=1 Tax=Agrilactobacillus fermenti TaxID=2586909 RepID=UPI001E4D0DA2|nr:fumarylacetoacetate hydrolase family protein [Agrilactobacillus fermenti]MCD2256926.1 fumarylacetoacetate hydrolase family protein [Agrilactobacillus fermenti]
MKLGQYLGQPVVINPDAHGLNRQRILGIAQLSEVLDQLPKQLELAAPEPLDSLQKLTAPIVTSKQIFGVGFNYRDHMLELHTQAPKQPNIFTKFVSSITGPNPTVKIPSPQTDWESELVVVIGNGGRDIPRSEAEQHIAGYMVGQDLSDRQLQFANAKPQFSLAKSYAGFSPIGPWITTPDEIKDIGALKITTQVNGVVKQTSTLKNLIFDSGDLVHYLSQITELYPGDLIFTGTPGGVGYGRQPKEFLHAGDTLVSEIEQLGRLTIQMTASL